MGTFCELEKRGDIFFLTLTGEGDNDQHGLNPDAIEAVKAALEKAKAEATRGSVLITTARGKFFSNGFDLAWAQAAGGSATEFKERLLKMVECFRFVVAELMSFPMPTIAAVNGHAAAAGFALAMYHDYVLMRGDRGSVMYMSELDIGMTFPDYFTALMRSKLGAGNRSTLRDVMLRATKLKAEDGVKLGIVESAHDGVEAAVEAAVRLAEELGGWKWDGEVYGEIRKSLYPEICGALGLSSRAVYSPRRV
uniref:Delta(3)-Delta(2)-enoyl-CoA isomerase n=1 Tax=Kalanchoe fedtschenkoi TaxID=63787 RepID=A0A7N1A1S7_KALFE